RALSEVVQAVAEEQPLLVFLDDAQWLDRESLLALGAAARDLAGAPAPCVITAAPQPSRPELDERRARLGRQLSGTTVQVGSLGAGAVRELAHRPLRAHPGEQR